MVNPPSDPTKKANCYGVQPQPAFHCDGMFSSPKPAGEIVALHWNEGYSKGVYGISSLLSQTNACSKAVCRKMSAENVLCVC